MNLNNNPIFLTQKRLVHRGGVLAAILIAVLVGFSLLSGLIAYRAAPEDFTNFHTPQEAGNMFYGWTIAVQVLVLVIGGFSRISRSLGDERKAGLWDSNRLTPLKPSQLVVGYWLGSSLREFYMALVLAITGLAIVLLAQLPITVWLETQILIFSTALFFGLLAVLVGMTFQRPQGGIIFILLFFLLQPLSCFAPKFLLTNFILPTYGIVTPILNDAVLYDGADIHSWGGTPHIFGLPVSPVVLSLGLQFIIGIFLWRAATRKTANPFQPLMLHWEAVSIFGILLVAQHGLIWELWQGKFPTLGTHVGYAYLDDAPMLSIAHCGIILLGLIILSFSSPQPETVRLKTLRLGIKNLKTIFSGSAVSLALILAAVAAAVLFSQFAFAFTASWKIYLVAGGNLLAVFLIFSLLFEFCRLRYRRRALGFVALWLFALCFLPFILAGVFATAAFAKLSLLSPGVVALSENNDILECLLGIVAAHLGIALLLFIAWQREWRRLLAKTSTIQN